MNLSPWEVLLLLVLALLIFGPDKLPELARGAGRMISRFKAEASGALDELKLAAEFEELKEVTAELRSTQEELKRSAGLVDATASGAVASASAAVRTSADGPPPFDPEAT